MMEYDRAVLGCIVDNHSDIVSFLFACWKRRHLISNGLTLVHFDVSNVSFPCSDR